MAALVRGGGGRLRACSPGYVRNYALAVAVGAVAILCSPCGGRSGLSGSRLPILTLLVLVPAVGAAAVALLPQGRDDVVARVGLGIALLVGLLCRSF